MSESAPDQRTVSQKTRPAWQPWVVLAVVFSLGVVAGGAGMRARILSGLSDQLSGANGRTTLRLRAMKRHLDLSNAQSKKIEAILDEARAAHDEAKAPCREQVEATRTEVRSKIDAVLTKEQQAKHETRRRSHRRGPSKHDRKRRRRRRD